MSFLQKGQKGKPRINERLEDLSGNLDEKLEAECGSAKETIILWGYAVGPPQLHYFYPGGIGLSCHDET